MYDSKTHKEILQQMKEAFSGNVNTGEGSFVESVLSPAALELVEATLEWSRLLKKPFRRLHQMKH